MAPEQPIGFAVRRQKLSLLLYIALLPVFALVHIGRLHGVRTCQGLLLSAGSKWPAKQKGMLSKEPRCRCAQAAQENSLMSSSCRQASSQADLLLVCCLRLNVDIRFQHALRLCVCCVQLLNILFVERCVAFVLFDPRRSMCLLVSDLLSWSPFE